MARRRYNEGRSENEYGRFGRRSFSGPGFGTRTGMQKALNRYLSHKAMFEGQAFVCPSFHRHSTVNVYGVSTAVIPVDANNVQNLINALRDYATGNKQESFDVD